MNTLRTTAIRKNAERAYQPMRDIIEPQILHERFHLIHWLHALRKSKARGTDYKINKNANFIFLCSSSLLSAFQSYPEVDCRFHLILRCTYIITTTDKSNIRHDLELFVISETMSVNVRAILFGRVRYSHIESLAEHSLTIIMGFRWHPATSHNTFFTNNNVRISQSRSKIIPNWFPVSSTFI